MPRVVQAVAFFVLLGAGYVVVGPFTNWGAVLAFLLVGSIIVATVTHVIPWVYFRLHTEPKSRTNDTR